jgi:succinyl-diaminopimelate desuccinylase
MCYGRGVADMKGSLAAMMAMAARFTKAHPNFQGSLGFLITSGEEGDDFDKGTPYVMSELQKQGINIDYCVVGEPSSTTQVGDVIKIGRRGSLTGKLQLNGIQGHVAYPHLAKNPIHMISPALAELAAMTWDEGNAYFPPTTFQVTHIHAGGEANNIIPGKLSLHFNFRFSTEQTCESLQEKVLACFHRYDLNPSIAWRLSGEPFLTSQGVLLNACTAAITSLTKQEPALSTSGGTSDGRFIAPYGVEVVELGPVNASIHQVNECVSLADLEMLGDIYYAICENILKMPEVS